jgi:hypothetical protein
MIKAWMMKPKKVTVSYGSDFCTGGTATSGPTAGWEPPANGFDDTNSTYYQNRNSLPCWLKYDLGSGITKTGAKYTLTLSSYGATYCPTEWKLWGSNTGTDDTDVNWVELDSRTGITWSSAYEKKEYEITNTTAYRYYRWSFSNGDGGAICIAELEIMETA